MSDTALRVTLLASEWSSSMGGLSTINRQLATLLAKHKQIEVTLLVPQFACSEEEKRAARNCNVIVREAERRPGYNDPLDWLSFPPRDLAIDIVLGHGERLGKQAQVISESHSCKWVQVMHTVPAELGMFNSNSVFSIRCKEDIRTKVDLCKLADLVVAVGPKVQEAYCSLLHSYEKHIDIYQLTPDIFSDFLDVKQATKESDNFQVLIFGSGDPEDFILQGYDTAAKAIVELMDRTYRLIVVGAPDGKQEEVAVNFLMSGISREQLIIRTCVQSKERLKKLFCEVDLAIMPSMTGEFGLTALAALSAGLPILVSGISGFGYALRFEPSGKSFVVDSDDPKEWAKAIAGVRQKDRAERLQEIQMLRNRYKDHYVYSFEKQCNCLVEKMWNMVHGSSVPHEIQAQGHKAEAAYQKALKKGSVKVYRGRIMLLGQGRAGKTSLKKSLLGIPFDPKEESTLGVKVDPSKCEVGVDQVQNWQCTEQKKLDVSEFNDDLAKIIARDLQELEGKDPKTIDKMDLEQADDERLKQSEASPTMGDSIPDSNQVSKTEIDPPSSNVPQRSMPADQDTQSRIDTTAVLPNDVMEMVEQYLQGLKLEDDIKAKEVMLSVWDFAGQHLYYASHSIFLSLRAVYVLVHNLSKDLSTQAEPCARQGTLDILLENPTNQTNLDNLLSWLVSVHCIRPTRDEADDRKGNPRCLRPPVFIVGTHADKPFEDIVEMERCIKKSIKGKAYEKHVIRPFFAVDNTGSLSGYGVQSLQNKIMEVLNQEPYMGEEVPIRWFNFEKVVEELVATKIYHMDLDQLLTVTKRVCRIDDEEELSTMLDFYHDLGVIVKFGRTVVLQAQWLIDLFKLLITVRPYDEVNSLYSECWQELEESGILRMALVDHVFADLVQKGLSKEDILNMMELYGLIAKLSFLPADGEQEERYFVPAQLRSSPSELYQIEPSDCDPCPLYLEFLDGFVPHGLFAQLLARCIRWCSEYNPKTAPNLYQNGARLFIGKQTIFYLILICRKRFIKVILKRKPASAPPTTATMASDVRAFLEDTLKVMSHELSWLRNLKYELCVACAHCLNCTDPCDKHRSVCCTHDDCLRLLPLRPKGQMICPINFGDEPIAPVGLEQWLLLRGTEFHPDVGAKATSQVVPEQQGPLCTAAALKVTLLGDEWSSSAGGLSTLNRELAIHLAKQPRVDVTFFVPEGACTDVHKNAAQRNGITVIEAKERPGYDRLDWLSFPSQDLRMDVVIGHGMKLGCQGQVLKDPRSYNCKWVQVVHTAPEQLGMFKSHSGAISKGGKKHQTEVDLCKLADLVVPIGPKLAEAYSSYLRCKGDQDIFTLTPGLFREFTGLKRNANENSEFKVLLCGRGDAEDFKLKGYDIAAKAFADQELKGEPYRLLFVGAPDGKEDEVAETLLNCGIAEEQLTVRKFVENREKMKDLFCEVDLAIMPSRTEGFGLIVLEALSAGLPILVSGNSGFARALQNLQFDNSSIVDSKEPKDWAKAIKTVRARHGERLLEIETLRESYGQKYSWETQCTKLVEKMRNIVQAETSQPSVQEDLRTNWNVLIIVAVLIGILAVIAYAVL
ncbi:uncharacterized protein LOC144665651 [Oculina patagonica]